VGLIEYTVSGQPIDFDTALAQVKAERLAKELPPRHPDGSGRFHRPTGFGPSLRDVRQTVGGGSSGPSEGSDPEPDPVGVRKSDGLGLFTYRPGGQSGTITNRMGGTTT
jgi:hypothetical protein